MKSLFMFRHLVFLLCFLSGCGGPAAELGTAPANEYSIEILRTNSAGSLLVTYSFESPISELALPGYGDVPLEVRLEPKEKGFVVDGGVVRRRSGLQFSAITFVLDADVRKIDRAYPTLFKTSSDALVIFPDNLTIDQALPSKITISARPSEGVYAAGGIHAELILRPKERKYLRRYLMIGEWERYSVGAFDVIGAEKLPEISANGLRDTLTRLSTSLAIENTEFDQSHIGIFIDMSAANSSGLSGDVVADGSMRLSIPPNDPNSDFDARLAGFIAHEFFHIWSGLQSDSIDGIRYPWLHEGMAELFGIAFASGGFANASAAIVQRLQSCADILGAEKNAGQTLDYSKGNIPYSCGLAFQWYFLEAIGIDPTDFDTADYARILSEQVFSGALYGPQNFFSLVDAQVSQESAAKLREFSELPAPDNLSALISFVNSLETPINGLAPPKSDMARDWQHAMWHVVAEICPAGWRGFGSYREDFLHFDFDPKVCAPELNDLKLVALNGLSLFGDKAALVDEIIVACANASTLTFDRVDSPEKFVTNCRNPVPQFPPLFR